MTQKQATVRYEKEISDPTIYHNSKYSYSINFSDLSDKKYYLYRHIRPDKNEPFYIGIGTSTKRPGNNKYARALSFIRRNDIWKRIFKKIDKIEIDILYESDCLKEIKQKEIEFIKLYGRINQGTGTLTNLTEGGEGIEYIKTISKNTIVPICMYDIYGNLVKCFESGEDCRRFLKIDVKIGFSTLCNPKNNYSAYGYFFRYKNEEFNEDVKKINVTVSGVMKIKYYKVLVTDLQINEKKTYNNIADFCEEININKGDIYRYIKGAKNNITKKTYKFEWV